VNNLKITFIHVRNPSVLMSYEQAISDYLKTFT